MNPLTPDTTTSEPTPSAWADGYREAIRDALTVCREIRDVVSDGTLGQQPSNAAAACCGAIARIVTPSPRTQAVTDVLAERAKQRAKWGDEHDDKYDNETLQHAAAFLAAGFADRCTPDWAITLAAQYEEDHRKQLVIAAALLLAEIERLDRAGGE